MSVSAHAERCPTEASAPTVAQPPHCGTPGAAGAAGQLGVQLPGSSCVNVQPAGGWRVADGRPAAAALVSVRRLLQPPARADARVEESEDDHQLMERADAGSALLLLPSADDSSSSAAGRPGLTLTVTDPQRAIDDVALLAEFARCELYGGPHGEYLDTAAAQLLEEVDGTELRLLRYRCRQAALRTLTIQCVTPSRPTRCWVYALGVTLAEAPPAPADGSFSLEAMLRRVEDVRLSEGADILRRTLQTAPGSQTALVALSLLSRPPTAAPSSGDAGKLQPSSAEQCDERSHAAETSAPSVAAAGYQQCVPPSTDGATGGGEGGRGVPLLQQATPVLGSWLEDQVKLLEERLWWRVEDRLERIEQKQDQILRLLQQALPDR